MWSEYVVNPLDSAFHIFMIITIFNAIPVSAPFVASFLAPFWTPFGVPFGSPFGGPGRDRLLRKHKEHKVFLSSWGILRETISGALLDVISASIWRVFWVVFQGGPWRWGYCVFVVSYFHVNYIFNSIMEAASWIEITTTWFHWIPALLFSRQLILKTTTPDRPQRLETEIRLKSLL